MTVPRPNIPTPVNSARALIEYLGLLMRVPTGIRQAAGAPLTWAPGAGRTDRTCIDRGTALMITLRAGYGAGVGIASAAPLRPADNTRQWKRWSLSDPLKTGRGLIFGLPARGDLTRALDFVGASQGNSPALSELLTRGTVYMATRSEPETGSSWLSVGLGRGQSPRTVLAALRQPKLWRQTSSALSSLIGRPITEGARPWSIALPVAGEAADRGIVRIGSTLWGRLAETPDKSARLAQQAGEFGADRNRAESLYSLVAGRNREHARVGVAAEYDFEDEKLVGAQFTLRVPNPLPGYAPQLTEMKDE
jgi:hypothetical protein